MVQRMFGAFAVALFAWQAGAQAADLSACQNVEGGGCCCPGNGVISSVRGNVSVGRGDAIAQANVGSSVFPGDRILARDGEAQVRLGPSCLTSVGANSVATVTQQDGLTCLALGPENPLAAFNPLLVGAAVAAVGGGIAAAIVLSSPSSSQNLSP